MKRLQFNYSTIIISILVICVFSIVQCIDKEDDKKLPIPKDNFGLYAGSAKCVSCHNNIYKQHINTAHYLTSQKAEESNIKGSFKTGKNTFVYNPHLYISMEKENGKLYQAVYLNGIKKEAESFDVTIGSGVKGQSYMFWHKNNLFQLPITYFTFVDQWVNSPGYPNKVQFNRPITSRCMECHATFAEIISEPGKEPEEFDRNRLILGVDCEKCHGPATAHINYQLRHPNDKQAKFIVNPARFSRQQSLDLCALCHGGRLNKTQPSFSYTSGESLKNYFNIDTASTSAKDNKTIDVHGNQYGLLKASKCFRLSETMTCNTCHNPHENERGNTAIFSQHCMTCHTKEHDNFCTLNSKQLVGFKNNCIDCHMPLQSSKAIVLFSSGQNVPRAATFRTHFISIYKDETNNLLNKKRSDKKED